MLLLCILYSCFSPSLQSFVDIFDQRRFCLISPINQPLLYNSLVPKSSTLHRDDILSCLQFLFDLQWGFLNPNLSGSCFIVIEILTFFPSHCLLTAQEYFAYTPQHILLSALLFYFFKDETRLAEVEEPDTPPRLNVVKINYIFPLKMSSCQVAD